MSINNAILSSRWKTAIRRCDRVAGGSLQRSLRWFESIHRLTKIMFMTELIEQNIQNVFDRIDQACQRVGRDPRNVKLILVSKTVEPEGIRAATGNGLIDVGENRV